MKQSHARSSILAPLLFIVLTVVLAGLLAMPAAAQDQNSTLKTITARFSQVTSMHSKVMLVEGSATSLFERSYLGAIRSQYPDTEKYPLILDSAYPAKGPLDTTVILIGGPAQNSVTKDVLASPAAAQGSETYDAGIGRVIFIPGPTTSYIILTDYKGLDQLQNTAAAKSPLAKVIPPAYVPLAASGIGLLLLWLWRLIAGIGEAAGEAHITRRALERSKRKHLERIKGKEHGRIVAGVRLKAREWIAIVATAIVFSLAFSYVYLQEQADVLQFVLINIGVNLFLQAVWHLVRLLYDRHYRTHTEYALWIWGALLTLVTGWLGNTFAIAGFTVRLDESKEEEKREGHSAFIVCIIVFALAAAAFLANTALHTEVVQLVGVVALTLVVLELLPFSPFSGQAVREWSRKAWWWLFVPAVILYIVEVII